MAIPEEYRVTQKIGFNVPNITYFVSRSAIETVDSPAAYIC